MVAQAARRVDGLASSVPIHPFLFAAYPVLRLYENNVGEVESGEVAGPLLLVLALTGLGLGLLTLLYRDARRAAIVTSAVVVPVMLFGLIVDIVNPVLPGGRGLLFVLCLAGVGLAVIVALRAGPRLGAITLALNVISVVLVVMTIVPAMRGLAAGDPAVESATGAEIGLRADSEPTTRDIYHLVFDRYGSEQALEAGFGIDNADFISWLRDRGFSVIDDAHANQVSTAPSLASTLSMSLLGDLAARMGPDGESLAPMVRLIRNSRAGAFLQDRGYEYVHVGSWYDPTRDSAIADRSYNPENRVSFATTLYDLSVLPLLENRPSRAGTFNRKHADSAEYEFGVLDRLAGDPGPKYVLAHLLVPHPPYVFLADGTFAPDRASFDSQLRYTNSRIQAFLEPLLALPEEARPIVILQADEGPYPKRFARDQKAFDWAAATDEELVTKYGILDAMYLPGPEGAEPLPPGMSPVNTYPEIFRRYFNADLENLEDRSFAAPKGRPYDLLEITERLRAAAG